MNAEFSNKKENHIYLKVSIVEPILLSCMNGVSFPDIQLHLQRVTTETILKEYLFYLVDGLFITYDGKKRVYLICKYGLELLNLIYIQKERKIEDYFGLSIKIE